jgi:hypothetical protein
VPFGALWCTRQVKREGKLRQEKRLCVLASLRLCVKIPGLSQLGFTSEPGAGAAGAMSSIFAFCCSISMTFGFAESDLHRWLEEAGFKKIEINVVAREEQPPHFETLLAGGVK